MCTVTFWPRDVGYSLGMNRDEQRTRASATPPSFWRHGETRILSPREPGAGTWIALNDKGLAFTLLNWYSVADRSSSTELRDFSSRGEIIQGVAHSKSLLESFDALKMFNMDQFRPFRLLGFSPLEKSVREWKWDGMDLSGFTHPWKRDIWASSGFEEQKAIEQRTACFRKHCSENKFDPESIHQLHRSHEASAGPFSICAHRNDARTVSFTYLSVSEEGRSMTYWAGSPCESQNTPNVSSTF